MSETTNFKQNIKALILQEIITSGPISVTELAQKFSVSTTAMRRHITDLEAVGKVIATEVAIDSGPGRPAKRYVATGQARAGLHDQSSQIANQALSYMRNSLGTSAVQELARQRARRIYEEHRDKISQAQSLPERIASLSEVMDEEGYATSVRPVGASGGMQLCQGNCPIETIAQEFPEFCQAETEVLSELLGVHVQRLATIAQGAHACTTHIPMETPGSSLHEERKE